MSEINEAVNTVGQEEDKGATSQNKSGEKDIVSLAPRKITDVKEIAKLWSHLKIAEEGLSGGEKPDIYGGWDNKDNISEVCFVKALELKRALYALKDPQFSKIISVDAMAFPALYCRAEVTKEEKWYDEVLFKDGEREDLLPLTDTRIGRDDPWKDERFDWLDANKTAALNFELRGYCKSGLDDESCIWVECKDCHGEGGSEGKVFAGRGERGQKECPHCGGTGKIGARLCPECKGYGHYYSYARVDKFKSGWVTCKTCGGKGKMKSVLRLNHLLEACHSDTVRFLSVPDGTIPSALPADFISPTTHRCSINFSDFSDYRELSNSSTVEGLKIPSCEINESEIKSKLLALHKKLLSARSRCLKENVSVGICTRYVRFHLRFLVGAVNFGSVKNNRDGSASEIAESAAKGILPKDYFTRMPHMRHECDMVLWMDMQDGCVYGKFPPRKDTYSYVDNQTVLLGILMKMGMSIPGNKQSARAAKKESNRPVETARKQLVKSKENKRWKFVVLGILFGWMGAHYIYAKRWGLFSLHVAAFIGLLIAPPLGLLWLATWFGGTFFVKKDGKKRLMV